MTLDVRLAEITRDSLDSVLQLCVAPHQTRFVAPNATSIAQAHFEPGAWFRAIIDGDEPVGFAMLHDPTLPGAEVWPPFDAATIHLWRFMIDHRRQRRGIGAAAIGLIAAHARTRPRITRFNTTYSIGPGGPEGFYTRVGFVATRRPVEDEFEAVMTF